MKLRTVQHKIKRLTRQWLYTIFSVNTNHSTVWDINFQVIKSLLPTCLHRQWTPNASVKTMCNFVRLAFHTLLREVFIYCYAYLINIRGPTYVSMCVYVLGLPCLNYSGIHVSMLLPASYSNRRGFKLGAGYSVWWFSWFYSVRQSTQRTLHHTHFLIHYSLFFPLLDVI
jgi:hypothetical protein